MGEQRKDIMELFESEKGGITFTVKRKPDTPHYELFIVTGKLAAMELIAERSNPTQDDFEETKRELADRLCTHIYKSLDLEEIN